LISFSIARIACLIPTSLMLDAMSASAMSMRVASPPFIIMCAKALAFLTLSASRGDRADGRAARLAVTPTVVAYCLATGVHTVFGSVKAMRSEVGKGP